MTFTQIAREASRAAGHPNAFLGALLLIVFWAAVGPFVGFSDSWMLWVNTGTTIVTFLMVFLLQHSQATADQALHAKLDELIKSQQGADNRLMRLEEEEAAAIEDIRKGQAEDICSINAAADPTTRDMGFRLQHATRPEADRETCCDCEERAYD
jgi:low affinity Fe/Cu permease